MGGINDEVSPRCRNSLGSSPVKSSFWLSLYLLINHISIWIRLSGSDFTTMWTTASMGLELEQRWSYSACVATLPAWRLRVNTGQPGFAPQISTSFCIARLLPPTTRTAGGFLNRKIGVVVQHLSEYKRKQLMGTEPDDCFAPLLQNKKGKFPLSQC